MQSVHLWTGKNPASLVTSGLIPPFQTLPDVVYWGVRTFQRDDTLDDDTHAGYRESFAVALVTETTGEYTEGQFQPLPPGTEQFMDLLRDCVNDWAEKKGWNSTPINEDQSYLLFISEVIEAMEGRRKKTADGGALRDEHCPEFLNENIELADLAIRVLHYCGRKGISLGTAMVAKHQYNITRPPRHGKNF